MSGSPEDDSSATFDRSSVGDAGGGDSGVEYLRSSMTRHRWILCQHHEPEGDSRRRCFAPPVVGATTGPIWGIFFSVLYDNWRGLLKAPITFLWQSMTIGVIFVVLFYILCGLPFVFLRPRFQRMPNRRHWPIALSVCAIGGFVAALIAPKIVWWVLGVQYTAARLVWPGDRRPDHDLGGDGSADRQLQARPV